MDDNIYDNGGFYWWMGVVEDRDDPLFLGRCRIRIVGYHTKDKTQLPTADLAWALPLQPITSAATTGIGTSPLGPVPGTWVVGFFADADDGQQPIFMGTFAGIPQTAYINSLGSDGFQDPAKQWPRRELLDEPDTNRLARNQGISETVVIKKKDTRDVTVETAFGGKAWSQPPIPYAAKYPLNHVTETETGHIIEIDDSPDAERLHLYHRTGTFVEIDAKGNMVRRIIGNDYQILDVNGFIHIKGKANVTVDGSTKIYVKNNCELEVDGNLTMHSHGNVELKSGKKMTLTAKDGIEINSAAGISAHASEPIKIRSEKTLDMMGLIKTTIPSPFTELGIVKLNSFSVVPIPPKPFTVPMPSITATKSPTETIIPDPGFALSAEDRAEFEAEKLIAAQVALEDTGNPTASEYVALKQAELDTNERSSAPSNEEITPNPECGVALKIVEAAKKDIGILETGTAANKGAGKNYGGKVGGGETPVGQPGRIDEMVRNAGLDNQAEVKRKGEGFYWCAAAVSTWWKAAGLKIPPGAASCRNWAAWGKKNGTYSKSPAIGAAALFGPEGAEHHIGIVADIKPDGSVITIEGNTGGGGFNRNGCGCFQKTPKFGGKNGISGFVHIPTENCDKVVQPATVTTNNDCVSAEMKDYIDKLRGTMPESVRQQLPDVVCKFGIDTPLRMSHFLSQCKHESINFTAVRENLSYSASALRRVFGKYFQTDQIAKDYEKKAEKIGNRAYASRNGNGDEASGDGYKYRGRGYIQLTGKSNYAAFRKFVPEDVVADPELVATKYPLLSAAWFWSNRNLNKKADVGSTSQAVVLVTRAVNGGINGLDERQTNFTKYYSLA